MDSIKMILVFYFKGIFASLITYFIFALPSRVFRLLGLCYSHILTASVVQEICTTHPKVLVHKQIEVPKNTNLKPLNTI